MKYLLGIDFGGGASKATLLAEDGRVTAECSQEYPSYYPKPGWVEQNPEDWVGAIAANIRGILQKSAVRPEDIAALSLDAATHTAVVMDADFRVLRPAIYWTDTRSVKQVAFLKESYNDLIQEQSLHNPDTIWTLPQLLWIRENEPEVWGKIRRIVFAKDYVRHLLTGDFVTDHIEAAGSMLYDCIRRDWSDALCAAAGIDRSFLPQLVDPETQAGTVTRTAAQFTGLVEGTPVLCGTTDTVMEVLAAGAVQPKDMTVKLATAGRICVITGTPFPDKNLVNYPHVQNGLWYPGTATKSCAASLRWYRDTFGGNYSELDEGAAQIPAGAEGLLFHPYINGELTPYADPLLCGSFTGIRAGHTKAHFTRAVLEGVCFSLLDCLHVLDALNLEHGSEAAIIGGGGKSPLWRQITADVLGLTLREQKYTDSSFGSAVLAGVTIGFWTSFQQALAAANQCLSVTEPDPQRHGEYAEIFKKYKAVQTALESIYHGTYAR